MSQQDSGVDVWSDATPLRSNADFRRLLETPRPHAQHTPRNEPPKPISLKKPPRQNNKLPPPTPSQDGQTAEPQQTPVPPLVDGKYRDRALERRVGVNPDYDTVTAEATAYIESKGLDDISKISVEDSKILGGDVQHTHLVKGLDFRLLQQERQRLEEEKLLREKMPPPEAREQQQAEMRFLTPMARSVYGYFFNREKQAKVKDNFLPGRTLFILATSVEEEEEDEEGWFRMDEVRMVRRPRSECIRATDNIIASRDKGVLDRVAQIMSYVTQKTTNTANTKSKSLKAKKKEKEQAELMLQQSYKLNAADPDEDIFGDAGSDYVSQARKKRSSKQVKFEEGHNSYFETKDEMGDLPQPGQQKSGGGGAQQKKKQKLQDGGDIDAMMGMGDAYTECFPEYHSYGGMYVDSDEEDMNQMDTKTKGKSRYDFSTEEEWQRYKLKKEATPKAAFQFGQKMGDGRVNQKNLEVQNQKKQNQKMKQELSKIEGIFKEKGYGVGNAFQDDNSGSGPTKKRKRLE